MRASATRAWIGAMPRARSSALRSAKEGEYSDRPQAMPISASRCSARPWREIRAAAADGRRLVHRRRQPGGGVEVLGVGEPGDRQAVRRERRRSDGRDAGQAGQDLAVGAGQQDRRSRPRPRRCRPAAAGSAPGPDPAARPARAASGGGGRQSRHRSDPVLGGRLGQPPGARAISERVDGARPAKATAQASTACPVGVSIGSDRPWPAGADRPGHSALSWSWSRCWAFFRSATSPRR